MRLLSAGHDVLIVERDAIDAGPDMTSGEVLAPATQHELDELGVSLEGDWVLDRVERVRNVYPDLSWTLHDFPPDLCYVHVDRGGLNAAMRRRFADLGGRIASGKAATNVTFTPRAAILQTRDGSEYQGKVLIDAAGRNAPSLTALKLKQPEPEFRQIGVALFFSSFEGTPLHCWDRHLYGDHGAMISGSRIRDGLYRYILEADLDDKQQRGMKPIAFYEHIATAYDPWITARIGATARFGEPWALAPLAHRAAEVSRDRLVLVGDAAGYLSPFTGQGIELALRGARLAAAAVGAAVRAGDFTARAFEPYVRGRNAELGAIVDRLRAMLRFVRDRDALLRSSTDDNLRAQNLIPLPVTARGSLKDQIFV
jgi:flavin-dependent dehydrogenase